MYYDAESPYPCSLFVDRPAASCHWIQLVIFERRLFFDLTGLCHVYIHTCARELGEAGSETNTTATRDVPGLIIIQALRK